MDEIKKDGTGDAITILAMGALILLSLPIVLPPLLLFGGLIAALMTGNRNFIKTTTKLMQTLCVIGALGVGIWSIMEYSAAEQASANVPANPNLSADYYLSPLDLHLKYGSEADSRLSEQVDANNRYQWATSIVDEHVMESRVGGLIALLAIVPVVLLKFRWADPLNRQFDKMHEAINRKKPKQKEDKSPPIMARDALTTYSVADELIKWKSLKEEGVIDEAEFVKIRDKLMQKDS